MAKNRAHDNERRERLEQIRRERVRRERVRSFTILGACLMVVVGLLTAALVPYLKDQRAQSHLQDTPVSKLGVSPSAASCLPVTTKNAEGNGQHRTPGTPITYTDAPPAFGRHWLNFLKGPEVRTFYSRSDRPELERLVHSLEHGHTIIWYDDTIKTGSKSYKAIQQITNRLGLASYAFAAPWTSHDENGKAFPSAKHVAMTHWTGPTNQQGVTQYCGAPSGKVIDDFIKKYPKESAPEAGPP
jgi:hypothetical protein